jgi:GLPGLI family protein
MNLLRNTILLIAFPLSLMAQSFEGKIVYHISYKDLAPEMEQMKAMLPGSQTIWIKGDKSRFEQNMAQGSSVVITDAAAGTSTILMDMMGQKYKIDIPKEEMSKMVNEQQMPEINYVAGTREIAGYTCKKAEVKMKDFDGVATFYYTEEIPPVKVKGMETLRLKGMFMAYEVKINGMTMSIEVSDLAKGPVADTKFTVPEGYTEMPEDIKNIMGLN